ncbi:MFS transporter, partial [Streptomyces sp. NPDC059766]|uniref:MFS transporter n=1 Tax=Streptomyces sp. NPDC059766 TaxID=3346940 RepID=UPI00364A65D3
MVPMVNEGTGTVASTNASTNASTIEGPIQGTGADARTDTSADRAGDRAVSPGTGTGGGTAVRAWAPRLVAVGIVLSALNLRPAITSLGALLEEVRDGLGMSGSLAGVLTSVPPLCFAVFGVMAPRLARRFGPAAVVCAGMVAITAGLLVRPYTGSTAGFVAASALALMGIAVSNVLMPVIVKRWFPDRVGSMTGLYSMALALGTSTAAAVTVPMTRTLGGSWQTGLAVWAGLAAAAVLPWLPLVRDRGATAPGVPLAERVPVSGSVPAPASGRATEPGAGPASAPGEPDRTVLRITRSRTAWALAVFFGLQATAAYITMGW